MYLKDKINELGGPENVMFIFPFKPLHEIPFMGIGFTSSNDESFMLPAIIDEERYRVVDGYKITLKCTIEGFGRENLYQSDLKSIIEQGNGQMLMKVDIQ